MKEELTLHFDGLCEPNPGLGCYGWTLKRTGLVVASGKGVILGQQTNNTAEYIALIAGLRGTAKHVKADDMVIVCGDSQLVINQVAGRWRCKSERLHSLLRTAMRLVRQLGPATFRWVPRDKNKEADQLARKALLENSVQPQKRASGYEKATKSYRQLSFSPENQLFCEQECHRAQRK